MENSTVPLLSSSVWVFTLKIKEIIPGQLHTTFSITCDIFHIPEHIGIHILVTHHADDLALHQLQQLYPVTPGDDEQSMRGKVQLFHTIF